MRGVPHVRRASDLLGEPADGDEAAATRDTFEEEDGQFHFAARRPPIGIRTIGLVWMCRDDIPQQDLVLDAELGEDAVDVVALASAGPRPVSWRSDVNGMPETRAPR